MPSQLVGQPASLSTAFIDCLMREGAVRQRHGSGLEGSQDSDKGRGKAGGMAAEFQTSHVSAWAAWRMGCLALARHLSWPRYLNEWSLWRLQQSCVGHSPSFLVCEMNYTEWSRGRKVNVKVVPSTYPEAGGHQKLQEGRWEEVFSRDISFFQAYWGYKTQSYAILVLISGFSLQKKS